ncbi:YbaN family protein [Gilvimarinus sp. F26214L]|uniref:YbaN family protein n=1 Tax=Gilvimarinus sp. DZF01 TaxID=3461371 RepID=UPI0040455522
MSDKFRAGRLPWLCLAWGSLGLGAAGVVLPLLPTTPFVLLAAWAAPKASPNLGVWLEAHPRFGALLTDWRRERAVPRRAKLAAIALMSLSWLLLWMLDTAPVALGFIALAFACVSTYLWTRPLPERERSCA